MQQRILEGGIAVSALGIGCIGMSEFYSAGNEVEPIADPSRDRSQRPLIDTADIYGVGRAIKRLDAVLPPGAAGTRYAAPQMQALNR